MTNSTTEDSAERRGFSSRWILDEDRQTAQADEPSSSPVDPVVAPATAPNDAPVGRMEPVTPPHRSVWRSIGSWTGRSILTIVFVAALVTTGMAVTAAYTAREQLDAVRSDLASTSESLESARAELVDVRADLADAKTDDAAASADVTAALTRRDELQLEVDVLRRMLLQSEQSSGTG